jgi:enoyl-CoA hydratase/carnithine racemase
MTNPSLQTECLTVGRDGPLARIVFDRPERRNAIDLAGWRRLAELVPALAEDGVRAIILTGRGENFCAGADITEFDTVRRDAVTARVYEAANSAAFAALRNTPVPVIAAIRGVCFGGGFGLAAAADLRIAAPDARFAVPAAKLGLAYPQDAMIDIVSSAGPQLARYLTFSAQPIDARRALSSDFLLEMVDSEMLETRANELARNIAENAPLSVRASKLSIAAAISGNANDARLAVEAGDATFDSADYAEGRIAFRERRSPKFTGR